jgi:hypothetical protein
MRKKQAVPRLPPLSLRAFADVNEFEEIARLALSQCGDTRYFNAQKALRIMRTCVVESVDVQLKYYKSLPEYRREWLDEIVDGTLSAIIGLVGTAGAEHWDFFWEELTLTVGDHLEAKAVVARLPSTPKIIDRKKLRDSYRSHFPGVKILDICWAAGQHYREWKRWLKQELKDGSTPDIAFRRVLTSGKSPQELNKKPRPSGWQ